MKFAVLGPLEVFRRTGAISVGSPRERHVLAALALHAGTVVSADTLIATLWDGAEPTSALKTLDGYVVHLRHALGSDGEQIIESLAPGYRLNIAPDDLDSNRFEAMVGLARTALATSDAATALDYFDQALALWRGTPFEEFGENAYFAAERARLTTIRRYAVEARISALLDLGASGEVVGDIESLLDEFPLSEELWSQLMVAQYRSGRQADALASFTRVSSALSSELGVDPGPHLRDVQLAVLTHDPQLNGPYTSRPANVRVDEPPFVGRETELYSLRAAWTDATRGIGHLVVVSGLSGLGKSRLLDEFAREVRASGGKVARARRARTPDVHELLHRLGSPLLVIVDEPMTPLSPDIVRDLPCLVVVGVDPATTPLQVLSGLAGADLVTLQPLHQLALERVTEWAGHGDLPRTVITDVAATVGGNPAQAIAEARAAVAAQNNAARVVAVADTSAARAELESARERLSSSLLASQLRRPNVNVQEREPWLGSAPYTEADQALFFGRDHVVADVATRIAELNRAVLVGPSGCGKTSLVRAGVLPTLAAGALPSSQLWQAITVRPGEVFERVGRDTVVFVDDVELLWTDLATADRADFIAELESAKLRGATLVLAISSEFVHHVATDVRLAEIVDDAVVFVPPLTNDDVRAVVNEPARVFGVDVDGALLDRVTHDVAAAPVSLTALSTALTQAWGYHEGARLTVRDYEAVGGLTSAVPNEGIAPETTSAADASGALPHTSTGEASTSSNNSEPTEATQPSPSARDRRTRNRLVIALMATLALLAVAIGFGITATQQQQRADSARTVSLAHQLAAMSQLAPSVQRSLLLAGAAVRLSSDATTNTALLNSLINSSGAVAVLHPGPAELTAVAASATGASFIAAGSDPKATIYNTASLKTIATPELAKVSVIALAARPGHTEQYAVSGIDNQRTQAPATLIWDVHKARATPLPGVATPIASFAWTTDGSWLVGAQNGGAVLAWSTLHPSAAPVKIPENSDRFRRIVAIGANRIIVFERHGIATVWQLPNASGGAAHQVSTFTTGSDISAVAASPDGSYFAVGHADSSVGIWQTSGLTLAATSSADTAIASALAFTPDDTRLVIGQVDGSLSTVATPTGLLISHTSAHAAQVTGLAIGPLGRRLYSASSDGSLIVWHTDGAGAFVRVMQPPLPANFTTDGLLVARSTLALTDSTHGLLSRFTVQRPQSVDTLAFDASNTMDVRLNSTGKYALRSDYNAYAALVDIATGKVVRTYAAPPNTVVTMAQISPDQKQVALTINDLTHNKWYVQIYDYATAKVTTPKFAVIAQPGVVEWDPRSSQVVVGSWGSYALGVYDASSGAQIWTRPIGSSSVAWSPDGTFIVSGGDNGAVSVVNAGTGADEFTNSVPAAVTWVSVSPDSRTIAVTDSSNLVHLIDVASQGGPGIAINYRAARAVFSSDGYLYVALLDGIVRGYKLNPSGDLAAACSIVRGNLSASEWRAVGASISQPIVCK